MWAQDEEALGLEREAFKRFVHLVYISFLNYERKEEKSIPEILFIRNIFFLDSNSQFHLKTYESYF